MGEPLETDETAKADDKGRYPGELAFGWTSHPKAGLIVFIVIGVLSAGLFLADFAVHRHEYLHIAEFKGFYALFGFAAFALVVLSGWPLRRLLGRSETYYEPEDQTDD